jgi:phosphoglycerol transferase MdoB-like AlkP superfamily enzyme
MMRNSIETLYAIEYNLEFLMENLYLKPHNFSKRMIFFKKLFQAIPNYIQLLSILFVLQMAFYRGFRYINYIKFKYLALEMSHAIPTAMHIGFQFDLQVAAYILLAPFLLLGINSFFDSSHKLVKNFAIFFAFIGMVASLTIHVCDMPYYAIYKNRISADAMIWFANPKQALLFLKNDTSYSPYILMLVINLILFSLIFRILSKKIFLQKNVIIMSFSTKLIWFTASALLMFHALRGAVKTRPMEISDAFISNNAFVNNLSLNPTLCFFFTLSIFKVKYFSSKEARTYVESKINEKYVHHNATFTRLCNTNLPKPDSPKNVIIVVLESMSAARMNYFGETRNLTPFLDSLTKQSIFFNNFYSCGTHTHNGLFGTLYGMPSLPSVHPFSNSKTNNIRYEGIASTLLKNNYSTSFYCTHNEEFDNLGFFLRKNGFENIYAEKNYPSEWNEHYLGISDEHLYQFALQKMDKKAKSKKPFFDCIMSVTSHLPGVLPTQTKYQKRFVDADIDVVHYADWALQQFIEKCKSKPWFKQTLFIILGDHGIALSDNYEAPLSLNHVPLFFYNTNLPPSINANFGNQADVYASIMHLLNIPYQNTSVSSNLFVSKNSKSYFIQDNQICCIDSANYLVMNKYGKDFLYNINQKKQVPIALNKNKFDVLKKHVYSFLQLAQEKMDETN